MKMNSLRTLATLAALALLAPLGMVQAQEVQLASHAEMNDLYARLAELESRIAATNVSGCGCADAAGNGCGCDDGCDDCCGCPGFVAGAEIVWLKAFQSDNDFGDFNYEAGFRGWIGYQGAGGLGIRFRDFEYFQRAANGDLVDATVLDFEIYDAVELGCNWDLIIGGGVRYIDLLVNSDEGDVAQNDQIFGTGPVVTAELYRHVSDRAALYAIVRESIVGGNGIQDGAAATDLTTMVSEIQLGGQIHRDWNGGLLFARLGFEAQHYEAVNNGDENVSLIGAVLGAGLMR